MKVVSAIVLSVFLFSACAEKGCREKGVPGYGECAGIIAAEVCGCNCKTYPSDCVRNLHQVNKLYDGPCDPGCQK